MRKVYPGGVGLCLHAVMAYTDNGCVLYDFSQFDLHYCSPLSVSVSSGMCKLFLGVNCLFQQTYSTLHSGLCVEMLLWLMCLLSVVLTMDVFYMIFLDLISIIAAHSE